jgi:hypothetical protein
MSLGEITGTVGVSLLLFAFALNILNRVSTRSGVYLLLNMVGAALACWSSYLISFWPFVVLEGVWTISSALMYFKKETK